MGGVPSTPRLGGGEQLPEKAESLIGAFVGEKSFPLASDYWQKLLELPFDLRWPSNRVNQACQLFAKIALIVVLRKFCRRPTKGVFARALKKHFSFLALKSIFEVFGMPTSVLLKLLRKVLLGQKLEAHWEECVSTSGVASPAISKALNALFLLSVFLKYLIENAKSDNFEELHLSMDESEPMPNNFSKGEDVGNLIMFSAFNFIAKVDIRTYLLHYELLNFMLIAMSTQLVSGPSPGPNDTHPFIEAAMAQETSLVDPAVHKLLLNYIIHPGAPFNSSFYTIFSEENQLGVLRRVGSAAANLMLLPFNYLVSSAGEASRSPLAENSLNVLLILCHYHKSISVDNVKDKSHNSSSESLPKEETYFSENPFCRAVENVRDIEFNRVDIEGNARNGLLVRLPFASLFDTLGMCLADERSVLLLYSLVHGNSCFLEYVLVRADMDTLLMPMLETLYNSPKRTANHIYMVLIILLILSQDSSFNASVHKLMLPNVPWYQNAFFIKLLLDVYLHTNCLATLANMAPHVHRLSAYASQQLVSLFDILSRKYNKFAEVRNDEMKMADGDLQGDSLPEDPSSELHIYTDFLRLVLEILNSVLTFTLPRNPEVVYAIMHRQEVFLPFKNHPRFNELLENIYTVLDFFNSRMDAQKMDDEWSVEKVLQVIINNCRYWRGEGMKMFTQLRFTYEQESHPEDFFIPYIWQLVLSGSDFSFNPSSINLSPVPVEDTDDGVELEKLQSVGPKENALQDGSSEVVTYVDTLRGLPVMGRHPLGRAFGLGRRVIGGLLLRSCCWVNRGSLEPLPADIYGPPQRLTWYEVAADTWVDV
ncbi:Dymeclin [Sesamum angolense]|uniref:Dymeclin n=1 Tax=Sesamum angolense TaxID=2727404 RepID=A0AAE1T888_9LAMI|nr:Dymeclin [Sesamum angolense]